MITFTVLAALALVAPVALALLVAEVRHRVVKQEAVL